MSLNSKPQKGVNGCYDVHTGVMKHDTTHFCCAWG